MTLWGKHEGLFHLFIFHVQERVREHDGQGKDQEEAERSVDESNVERSFPKFRWMGHEDCNVGVYEQHNEDTKQDGRSKKPFEHLENADISQNVPKDGTSIPR